MTVVSRQSRKKSSTHTKIMHAAKNLFEEKSINKVSVDEISEMADVSRSTFFNHFATIDDLITELANQEIADLMLVGKGSNLSGVNAIKNMFGRLVDDTYKYPSLMIEVLMKGILNANEQSRFLEIVEYIKVELRADNICEEQFTHKEIVGMILGGFFGVVLQKLISGEKFDDKEATKVALDKILNTLIFGGLL